MERLKRDRRIRDDVDFIIQNSIRDVLPDRAVKNALSGIALEGDVYVAAFGKAAWQMAFAAEEILGQRIRQGVIVTKYGHSKGPLTGFEVIEAGHPVPDGNSSLGAERIMALMAMAEKGDTVILLVSGGGSALIEKPAAGLSLQDIQSVTEMLLKCGAAIQEMNVIRKRLSAVKGGKLAKACRGARIYQIVLSDIIDDNLEMIASGPACEDTSTYGDVMKIKEKYHLTFPDKIEEALKAEPPTEIGCVNSLITGSVRELCRSVARHAQKLGYSPVILTTELDCEAKEAGKFMASIARSVNAPGGGGFPRPCALIAGGETVVNLTGSGKGGRNQELALSAAGGIEGLTDTVIFSVGSDGTDGPTDAAGGVVDGTTVGKLKELGIDYNKYLRENDSYSALKEIDGLIITGATGTNVNDVAVVLCK